MILLNMIRDLDYGFAINGMNTQPYNIDNVKQVFESLINNHNITMQAKDNPELLSPEDFILYADMKDQTK